MIKNLRKNKKGFTLIEIIVVLVIMGILLAIAVPSILGYVNKANDAKYLAQARGGYLAAQTITGSNASKGTKITINAENVNEELGLKKSGTDEAPTYPEGYVTKIGCTLDTAGNAVKACNVVVYGMKDGEYVNYENGEATVKKGTITDGAFTATAPK